MRVATNRHHDLPSHLRASTADAAKAPHSHVIGASSVVLSKLSLIPARRPQSYVPHDAYPAPSPVRPHSRSFAPQLTQIGHSFFRRISRDPTINFSTEKCLLSANHIVRLVKLQRNSAGLRMTPTGFQQYVALLLARPLPDLFRHSAMFCAGTILAVSAIEDGISPSPALDALRRTQARNDLRTIVEFLREAAITWPTASTSANILEGPS